MLLKQQQRCLRLRACGWRASRADLPLRSVQTGATATLQAAAPAELQHEVPRGDTAGATLIMEGITLQAGDRELLKEASWTMMPGQRVGLVGANGCGKSTLLRCIYGYRSPDMGRVYVAPRVEVGYLEQTAVSGSTLTVWDEARSRMTHVTSAEAAMDAATQELSDGVPGAAVRLAEAQAAFEAAGGYEVDKRIAGVLQGLGFSEAQYHRSCQEFSGGWQMRIALARLLLGPAGQAAAGGMEGGLLLLDEPTNHLDSAAIKWLSGFLANSGGSMVIVSHDEALLQGTCDRILEVRGRQLHAYACGYRKFLEQRKMREEQATATAAAQQAEIARLEDFVRRFGAKASKASQAQSRAKQLEKLRAQQVEAPAPAAGAGPGDARKVALRLPPAPPCHQEALILKSASIGWGAPPGPGAPPLLSGVDLTLKRGQRVLVLGPNGAGKSTLLKALSGKLPLWGGSRKEGDGVRVAVFSQDLAQDLPQDVTPLDYVFEAAVREDRGVTQERCRGALGALGLSGSMALQKIGVLSGGEKARVALAAFAMVPANVLLLDEASNHLDAQTISVLTAALQEFKGAIVAITHNPAFAESLRATHLLRVSGGTARLSDNFGLSARDFIHTPAAGPSTSNGRGQQAAGKQRQQGGGGKAGGKGSSQGALANGAGAVRSSASSSSNTTTSSSSSSSQSALAKGAAAAGAVRSSTSSSSSATSSSSSSSSNGGGSSSSRGGSRAANSKRALGYKERIEYERLESQLEKLGSQKAVLEARVAALAADSEFKALQQATQELGQLAAQLEAAEERWLELAEIAGDV